MKPTFGPFCAFLRQEVETYLVEMEQVFVKTPETAVAASEQVPGQCTMLLDQLRTKEQSQKQHRKEEKQAVSEETQFLLMHLGKHWWRGRSSIVCILLLLIMILVLLRSNNSVLWTYVLGVLLGRLVHTEQQNKSRPSVSSKKKKKTSLPPSSALKCLKWYTLLFQTKVYIHEKFTSQKQKNK